MQLCFRSSLSQKSRALSQVSATLVLRNLLPMKENGTLSLVFATSKRNCATQFHLKTNFPIKITPHLWFLFKQKWSTPYSQFCSQTQLSSFFISQVKMLWFDPSMRGWQHRTPYSFNLELTPSIGRMRQSQKWVKNFIN